MAQGGIRPGRLNRKVEFYRQVNVVDDAGQETHSWTLDFSAMCDVRFVRGSEMSRHGREEMATILATFTMYFNRSFTVKHRAKFNGDFYDVQNFAPAGSLNRRHMSFTGELIDASQMVIT